MFLRQLFARRGRAVLLAGLLALLVDRGAYGAPFDQIQFWVGDDGPDHCRAALVIDWNDGLGPESLVWGYRWDPTAGAPTGADMLLAVVQADPRLRLVPGSSPSTVFALGYDLDGDGFDYVPGAKETGQATDIDDHYREGWMYSGYWRYYLSSNGADWNDSGVGMAGRVLAEGSWDGWSWSAAPTWDGGPPGDPVAAAVPEPTSLLLLAAGAAAAGLPRVRRRSAAADMR